MMLGAVMTFRALVLGPPSDMHVCLNRPDIIDTICLLSLIFIHDYHLNSSQDVNLLNLLSSRTTIAMTKKVVFRL